MAQFWSFFNGVEPQVNVHPSTSQPLKAVKFSPNLLAGNLWLWRWRWRWRQQAGTEVLTCSRPATSLAPPLRHRFSHSSSTRVIIHRSKKRKIEKKFIFYVVQVSQYFRNLGHRIFGEFLCEFVRVFDCFGDAVSALPNVSVSRLPSLSQLHFTPKLFGFRSSSALWIAPLPRLTYYCVVLVFPWSLSWRSPLRRKLPPFI